MVLACVHETVWHIHANDCRPVSFNGPNHPACFYIPKPNNCNERILCYRFNDDYDGKCHYMNLPPQKTGSCLWDLLPRLSLSKSVPSKSVKTVFKVFLVLKTKYLLAYVLLNLCFVDLTWTHSPFEIIHIFTLPSADPVITTSSGWMIDFSSLMPFANWAAFWEVPWSGMLSWLFSSSAKSSLLAGTNTKGKTPWVCP